MNFKYKKKVSSKSSSTEFSFELRAGILTTILFLLSDGVSSITGWFKSL